MGGSRDQPQSVVDHHKVVQLADPEISHSQCWIITRCMVGSVGGSRDQPQSVVDHHKVVPWADPEISHSQWWIITRWYRGRIQVNIIGGTSKNFYSFCVVVKCSVVLCFKECGSLGRRFKPTAQPRVSLSGVP